MKEVYWHSTAHVLGEAMERTYGGCLCYGPPIEQGFYYDMFMDGRYFFELRILRKKSYRLRFSALRLCSHNDFDKSHGHVRICLCACQFER